MLPLSRSVLGAVSGAAARAPVAGGCYRPIATLASTTAATIVGTTGTATNGPARHDSTRHHRGVSSSSSWVTPHQRHRHRRLAVGSPHLSYPHTPLSTTEAAPVQQRYHHRPLVNGKSVAFHVRDLPLTTTTDPYASSSSFAAHGTMTHHSHHHHNGTNKWHVNNLRSSLSTSTRTTPKRTYKSDLIVLLDLDECLVHTSFTGSQSQASSSLYAHQKLRPRQSSHSSSNPTTPTTTVVASSSTPSVAALESFRFHIEPNNSGPMAHVTIRPGVIEFLRHVTERYETHIFTAALPIYADSVIDALCDRVRTSGSDTNVTRRHHPPTFSGRWYRHDCEYHSKENAYVKNLSRLSLFQANPHRLSRAVLVDNNPSSFLTNPENGILVDSFYDCSADTALQTVRALLDGLDESVADVRPVLREQWRQLAQLEEQAILRNQYSAATAAAAPLDRVGQATTPVRTRSGATNPWLPPNVVISSQVLHQDLTRQMMAI